MNLLGPVEQGMLFAQASARGRQGKIYSEDAGTTHDIVDNKGPIFGTHDVHENTDT
jgi:hypothetical protein